MVTKKILFLSALFLINVTPTFAMELEEEEELVLDEPYEDVPSRKKSRTSSSERHVRYPRQTRDTRPSRIEKSRRKKQRKAEKHSEKFDTTLPVSASDSPEGTEFGESN